MGGFFFASTKQSCFFDKFSNIKEKVSKSQNRQNLFYKQQKAAPINSKTSSYIHKLLNRQNLCDFLSGLIA